MSENLQAMKKSLLNLDTDCFDEIMEYLPLEDLYSFGQTCKSVYKVAGKYFQRNFHSLNKYVYDDGIYTTDSNSVQELSAFNEFIKCLSYRYDRYCQLNYIESHVNEFKSLNEITFEAVEMNEYVIESFQAILPKIEVVKVESCSTGIDFDKSLFQFCSKLKEISVHNDSAYAGILNEGGNQWMNQEYSSLKVFRLHPKLAIIVRELSSFLEKNPSIHTFSTTSMFLRENREDLLQCDVKLDVLEISDGFVDKSMDFQTLSNLLIRLYKRGFYQRLHLEVDAFNEEDIDHFASLDALESLTISDFNGNCDLSRLNNLKKLSLSYNYNGNDMSTLAMTLPKLKELSLNNATLDDLCPFIRQSVNLRNIRIFKFKGTLDFVALNNEREKLDKAQKITIHVAENTFLDTKWKINYGNLNLNLIEIRRTTSQ